MTRFAQMFQVGMALALFAVLLSQSARYFHSKKATLSEASVGGEDAAPGVFEKTLKRVQEMPFFSSAGPTVIAACDQNAFTCNQVVEFISQMSFADDQFEMMKIFTSARNGNGCISDPENSRVIFNLFSQGWGTDKYLPKVDEELNKLKPAVDSAPSGAVLLPQTGIRTDAQMFDLFVKLEDAWNSDEQLKILEDEIAVHKEQFTGEQMLHVMDKLRFSDTKSKGATILDQYMTGITCVQVIQMLQPVGFARDKLSVLECLVDNIVDCQFKGDIVQDGLDFSSDRQKAAEILRGCDPALPPKNNPVFGVVKGDPIILVVDNSGSMYQQHSGTFKIGDKTYSRKSYCEEQLKNVLDGLSPSSNFNLIVYSQSARKAFPDFVPVSEDNIAQAMTFLQRSPNGGTNSFEALRMAYDMQTSPHQEPQIYFLTDGQPTSPRYGYPAGNTPERIVAAVDDWDAGRKIPVNSIAFIMPGGDPVARSFMKSLAEKTGGFFRAVEEDPNGTNDQSR